MTNDIRFTISSDTDNDDAIKHRIITKDIYSYSDFFVNSSDISEGTDICLPEFIGSPENINSHAVLVYLLHHLTAIIDHNRRVDSKAKASGREIDYDDYRDGRDAYVDTVLHFGSRAVIEYVNRMKNDTRVDLSKFERLLIINANLYKGKEADPDHRPVDILVHPGNSTYSIQLMIETRL